MNARTVVGFVVAGLAALTVIASEVLWPTPVAAAPVCNPLLNQRTPEEVLADFRAALAAANWAAVRCNLDDDAVWVSDNFPSIFNGPDEIVAEFQLLAAFYGGTCR